MYNQFVPNVSKWILILSNKQRDVNKTEVMNNNLIWSKWNLLHKEWEEGEQVRCK